MTHYSSLYSLFSLGTRLYDIQILAVHLFTAIPTYLSGEVDNRNGGTSVVVVEEEQEEDQEQEQGKD